MPDQFRVGYVLKQYPRLSETFVLNEIIGLEEHGMDVSITSLRPATEGRFHPALGSVRGTVTYLDRPDRESALDVLRAMPEVSIEQLPAFLDFLDRLPPERRSRLALHAVQLAGLVSRQGLHHLHAHFLTVAAHTAYLTHLLTGVPFSVTAHAKDIYRHTVDWDVARTVAEAASTLVTVCSANLRHLDQRLGDADVRLTRVYNGLDLQGQSRTLRRHDGLVLGVGRLVEKKGFDLLLRAIAELAPQRPELRCVIIGEGECRAALEQQALDLGIDDRVSFLGALSQTEVRAWMDRASLLAAPCRVGRDGNQDALPTVLIEALAAGLPAVSTRVGGIEEIITDRCDGLLVDPDDLDGLTGAVDRLLVDDRLRSAMATAGPAKARDQFDRRATIPHLLDVFRPSEVVAA